MEKLKCPCCQQEMKEIEPTIAHKLAGIRYIAICPCQQVVVMMKGR